MSNDNNWIYESFLSQMSNVTNHYQYLIVLIISGSAFLIYKSNNTAAVWLAGISFLSAAANLIIGLLIYSAILNTVFDFTQSIDKPDLADPFRCLFMTQLIIGILSFIFLLLANITELYLNKKKGRKR